MVLLNETTKKELEILSNPKLKQTGIAYYRLKGIYPGLVIRESGNGVPHMVVEIKGTTYSICFFGTSGSFRVYDPWPSHGEPQNKKNCKTLDKVVEYLKSKE